MAPISLSARLPGAPTRRAGKAPASRSGHALFCPPYSNAKMHFQSFFVPLLTAQACEVAVVGPVEEFAALDRAPAGEEVALVVAVSLSHGYSHRPGGGDIALWGDVAGKPPLTGGWPHPSARGSAAAPAHATRCRQRCTD